MISVIVLTWNSERYIEKCLDSLVGDCRETGIDFEIFVVDNGSKDKTLELLEKLENQGLVKTIKLKENRGTTFSRNLAIKKSRGDYVLILDSDTEIKPGAIKNLVSVLKNEAMVGIVSPRLILADGSVQQSYKKFPTLQIKFLKALPFKTFQKLAFKKESYYFKIEKDGLYPVDYCISACWLVSLKAIEQVGLMDEKIFYSPEDVDYCLRIWLSGYRVVYCPASEVIHYTQRISYRNKKIALKHIQGLFYYFRKYCYCFSRKRIYEKISKAIGQPYPLK